jgi:N6-adenosine-specific RNA methylase IME4
METLHVLSKQSHQSLSMQNKIASYRLRVDRKRGEWLRGNIENGGDRRSISVSARARLKDVGIGYQESHILQRIASIPEDAFRNHIVATLKNGEELTTASILRLELALKFRNQKAPPLPKGRYSVIYADPPYEYEFAHTHIRAASEVYPTMTVAEICKMGKDVQRISAPNCTLLLWTPASHLDKFPAILEAWGFRYNTCWVWNKVKGNFSFYGSISHELLVIGGRGRSVPSCDPKTAQSVLSVQSIARTSHSSKPKEYYQIIEKLYPKGKYLELFSRCQEPRKGWTYWGDELSNDD